MDLKKAAEAIKSGEPLVHDLVEDGMTQSLLGTIRGCPTAGRMKMKGYHKPGYSKPLVYGSVFHDALDWSMQQYRDQVAYHPDWFKDPLNMGAMTKYLVGKFHDEYVNADITGRGFYDESYAHAAVYMPRYFSYWKEDFYGERQKDIKEIEGVFQCFHPNSPLGRTTMMMKYAT